MINSQVLNPLLKDDTKLKPECKIFQFKNSQIRVEKLTKSAKCVYNRSECELLFMF